MNLNNIKKRGSEQNEHNPRILQSSGLKMADSSSTHLTFPRKTDNIPPPPHPIVLLANSLALLVLPQLIIVGTIAIPLSASSLSWQQDQVGWMCATIILSMLAFSSPVGLINIMHSKPWITKGAVAAYVLAVLANTLSIGLQYFGGVHPIFFGWISAAAIWGFLAVVTSAIFVLDQKKLNQDKTSTAQPTINFKQIVTYTMMTGLAAGLITGGMIAFLIGNRVLEGKHNETLLTIALSLFYATIRLLLPWLAFDYLKLPLGEENRSFMKYQFNSAIDLMVNLSFPAIKNPVAITILIVSKAISFIMSGLWLIHPYSLWMKSEPFPRNPDSHVGLIGKILALCKLRLSKEGSTHEIYQIGTKKELQRWRNVNLEEVETWLDEAKTQFYLRTWAQLSGSVMYEFKFLISI
jgi:hypothetical protein